MEGLGDDRSISIQESAIGSTLISGNSNQVTIYHYQTERKELGDPVERLVSTSMGPNPYKGLLAFQETDAVNFFGREQQISQLWERFRNLHEVEARIRLLPIYGPSGSGKSSLARAGLIPELARRPLPGYDCPRVAVLVPGTHPLQALATVLARIAVNDSTPAEKSEEFERVLKRIGDNGDFEGLRRIADVLPGIHNSRLILLIDQFEEIYSVGQNAAERHTFISNLLHAAHDLSCHVSVIITVRSDFLGETQKHPVLNRLFAEQGFLVRAMDQAELRRAIAEPAKQAGYVLDEATVDLLIKDTEGREGALPLMEFALTRIWEGLAAGKEPVETLQEVGGVGGALAGEAQRIYDGLSSDERRIARRVFLELVQLGDGTKDTRRRTEVQKLIAYRDKPAQVKQVIARFSAPGVRLLTLASNAKADTVEVTHEALFDHWQLFRTWLDTSRSDLQFKRRLDEAAVHWQETKRAEGSLWRTPDLDLLRRYYQRNGDDMTPLQVEFFKASERFHNIRRYLRLLGIGGLIGGILSATYQLRQVESKRVEQLTTAAQTLRSTQPVESMIAALAAEELIRSPLVQIFNSKLLDSVHEALSKTLQVSREQNRLKHGAAIRAIAFSPKERIIVSGGEDGTIQKWDITTGQPIGLPLKGHKGKVYSLAFSPDGQTIVSGGEDGQMLLWDFKTGEPKHGSRTSSGDGIKSVVFSPNGQTIASGEFNGKVERWDAKTLRTQTPALIGHRDAVYAVAFSSSGQTIVSASEDGTLQRWNASTGRPIGSPLLGHKGTVYAVAFSPSGQTIVSGSLDTTMILWNVQGQRRGELVRGHNSAIYSLAFSPNGQTIVSSSRDWTLRLWDVESRRVKDEPLKGHMDGVASVAFSSDGQTVASGSYDGTVRFWDVHTNLLEGDKSKWVNIACTRLQHHSLLLTSSSGPAKEARQICKRSVWPKKTS